MIYLNNIGATTVTMTLYERCKSARPYFTFRLIHKQSRKEIVFSAADISQSPQYFNQFVFQVTEEQEHFETGKFNAAPGEYNYQVYESEEPRTIELAKCKRMVETGILKVIKLKPEIHVNKTDDFQIAVNHNR